MPNWCYNSLNISHTDPAMISKLIQGGQNHGLLNSFVPMPQELVGTTSPSPQNAELDEKYGASNWYDWAVKNWGTKWDTHIDDYTVGDDGTTAVINFNTAWSPPIFYYDRLVEKGFNVNATYTEEGMGFAGHYVNGQDECIELRFDDESTTWINNIFDSVLRELVQNEYNSWRDMQNDNLD